jgi:SAM-dependent methyltransferase
MRLLPQGAAGRSQAMGRNPLAAELAQYMHPRSGTASPALGSLVGRPRGVFCSSTREVTPAMTRALASDETAGFELVYTCALETMTPELVRAWSPLHADAATTAFLQLAAQRRQRRHTYWFARGLRQLFSDFDVNGWLGLYPMHLLSHEQARQLLAGVPKHSLLDVGAGNGDVTSCIASLFEEVQTTEHSKAMVRVLRRRGYACERVSIDDPLPGDNSALKRTFDVVTCLNVIDRTSHPTRLIARAASRVSPDGALVLAVPLPVQPFYYDGPITRDPQQRIELDGADWQSQCHSLVDWLTRTLPDFALWRLARCPYISGGDPGQGLYVLDDVVLVLRRSGAVANNETRSAVTTV